MVTDRTDLHHKIDGNYGLLFEGICWYKHMFHTLSDDGACLFAFQSNRNMVIWRKDHQQGDDRS